MMAAKSAGGPVIPPRRRTAWLASLAVGAMTAMAACAGDDRVDEADTATVPAVAVPMSDSAADSAARQAEERSGVSPARKDTANRPLIRPAHPDSPAARRPVVQRPDTIAVRLERSACLGGCPVYSVAIGGDGSVRYEGREHVERVGAATAKVPPAAVQAIVEAARDAGFFTMADRYAYGEPTCPLYTADSPRAFISITSGGRTKRIEHDYGCENGPPALVAIAKRIDSVAGAERWLGAR